MTEPRAMGRTRAWLGDGARACDVLGVTPERLVEVATPDGPREARQAVAAQYVPHLGDRVLVVSDAHGELYIVGVLRALRPAELLAEAPDGTTVTCALDQDGRARLLVRAPTGRVIVEHREGRTIAYGTAGGVEILAGEGPLTLSSDHEVRIEGKRGVSMKSARRVKLESGAGERATRLSLDGRGATLRAPELDVEADDVRLSARGVLRLAADTLETTAAVLRQRAESAELDVEQLGERARETYREVEELAQTRAGELRFVAKEAFRALAKHTLLVVRDYDWRAPRAPLRHEAPADERTGAGIWDVFGEHWHDEPDGRRVAEVRAQQQLQKGDVFSGTTYLRALRARHWFELTDHPNPDYNRRYVVIETAEVVAVSEAGYSKQFTAVPFGVVVRPERTIPWPRIEGLVSGLIDGESRSTATPIDDMGRYRVVLPLDAAAQAGGRATRWVRRAQPYSGEGYGMHMPLHIGTEVAIAHVNGDPDRPVILGAVPNASTQSPVTSANATAGIIRTGSGIMVEFEDDA